MSTNNNCENVQVQTNCTSRGHNGFIIIIVLYILLAIILGSRLY